MTVERLIGAREGRLRGVSGKRIPEVGIGRLSHLERKGLGVSAKSKRTAVWVQEDERRPRSLCDPRSVSAET